MSKYDLVGTSHYFRLSLIVHKSFTIKCLVSVIPPGL